MASTELNDLLRLLQNTAAGTQKKIDEMQSDRLSSVINADQNGQPDSLTLECKLPSGDGKDRTYEMLRIPLASLYSSEDLKIKEISIEFDCDVRKVKHEHSDHYDAFVITPLNEAMGDKCKDNSNCHTFKITSREDNGFLAESIIDDSSIEKYLDCLDAEDLTDKSHHDATNNVTRRLIFLLILLLIDLMLLLYISV